MSSPDEAHACSTASHENEKRAAELVAAIREESFGLPIKTHRRFFVPYGSSFIASVLVDKLVASDQAKSREEAVEMGRLLVSQNQIHHVKDSSDFSDSQGLFRFRVDDATAEAASAASLSAQCDVLSSTLKQKGMLRWKARFCMLQVSESTLFCFDDELQSKPRFQLSLEKDKFVVRDLGGARFSVASETDGHYTFEAGSSKEAGEWVENLINAGAEFQKEPIESTAADLFEFTPLDIDEQPYPLAQHRGEVCIVVNVASF
eukprot:TRINITY_DN1350_c0_g1_i2.p1 TRINITY_DN1350_c0_g1~~TRINITY_DN1350_c0_g1_i2.p1  ORF type:complete len:276 (-),score=93.00 TRINITY_DN1350_c0_g1_i2:669-1451(-)